MTVDRLETLTENQFRLNSRIARLEGDLIVVSATCLIVTAGIFYLATRKNPA